MATPYNMICTFWDQNGSQTRVEVVSFQDVANEYGVFLNTGNAFFTMPYRGFLKEVSQSVAGTVNFYTKLKARGLDTGIHYLNTDLISTRIPPHLVAPIPIEAGTMVQFPGPATGA
jgi:hypothetical protein